jgi:hypothetical protein
LDLLYSIGSISITMRLFGGKTRAAKSTAATAATKLTQEIDLFHKPTAEESSVTEEKSQRSGITEYSMEVGDVATPSSVVWNVHQAALQASQPLHQSHLDILQTSQPSLKHISTDKKKHLALQKLLCFDKTRLKEEEEEDSPRQVIQEYLSPEDEARQDDELVENHIRAASVASSRQDNTKRIVTGDRSIVSAPPKPPPKSTQSCTSSISRPIKTNHKTFVAIGENRLMAVGANNASNTAEIKPNIAAMTTLDMPTRTATLTRDRTTGKVVATKTQVQKKKQPPIQKLLCHRKHYDVLELDSPNETAKQSNCVPKMPRMIDAKTKQPIPPAKLQQDAVTATSNSESNKSVMGILQDLVIRPTWTTDAGGSSSRSMEDHVRAARGVTPMEGENKSVTTTESTLMKTCHAMTKNVFTNFLLIPESEETAKINVPRKPPLAVESPHEQRREPTFKPRRVENTSMPVNLDRELMLSASLSNVSSMTKSTGNSSQGKDSILKYKIKNDFPKLSRASVKFAAFDVAHINHATSTRNEIAWQRCKARQSTSRFQRRAARKGCIKKNCRENVKLASIAESDQENDDEPKPLTILGVPEEFTLFPSMNVCQGPYGSDDDVATVATTGEDSVTLQGLNHKLYRTSSPVPRFPSFHAALFQDPSNSVGSTDEDAYDDAIKLNPLEKLQREHHSETSSWMYYLFAKDQENEDEFATLEGNDSLLSLQDTFDGSKSLSGSEDEMEVADIQGTPKQSLWNFRGELSGSEDGKSGDDDNTSMSSNVHFATLATHDAPTMRIKLFQKSKDESSIVGNSVEDEKVLVSFEPVRMSLAL